MNSESNAQCVRWRDEVRHFCQKHADPAIVVKYSRFFVEGYDAYGIESKLFENQRDLWLKQMSGQMTLEDRLILGELLLESGKYEEVSYALAFVADCAGQYTVASFHRLGAWLDSGLHNWAHVDCFCSMVLAHFLEKRIIAPEVFTEWRNSPSKWKRRAVPVALIKALDQDIPQLFQIIDPMMLDPEKVVRQGLGWFLRECWKREAAPTEAFLTRWKDTCPRLIIQYATEKMSPEKKAEFKKAKGGKIEDKVRMQ